MKKYLPRRLCSLFLVAVSFFLAACDRQHPFLSDERVLLEAQTFLSECNLSECDYRIVFHDSILRSTPHWRFAKLPQYPDGAIYASGGKTYFCEDASGVLESNAAKGVSLESPYIHEVTDVSFAEYDAFANALLDVLKQCVHDTAICTVRYNREHITIGDYLYFDFTPAFLGSDAFVALTGERYAGGFISFVYDDKSGDVTNCSVQLWVYDETGQTQQITEHSFTSGVFASKYMW